MRRILPAKSNGFTIIELLIATAVFSVILLVITAAILQFSKEYYKGVVSTSTQGAARTLIDDISRSIQFNGGDVVELKDSNDVTNGYCVGTGKRYSLEQNQQVIDSGPNPSMHRGFHGLVSDSFAGCSAIAGALDIKTLPADLTSSAITPRLNNPRELLGERMRISKLDIQGAGDVYTVTVRIVYGDDDLLCSPEANDCARTTISTELDTADDLSCKTSTGSQFCSVSELSTTVKKRVK